MAEDPPSLNGLKTSLQDGRPEALDGQPFLRRPFLHWQLTPKALSTRTSRSAPFSRHDSRGRDTFGLQQSLTPLVFNSRGCLPHRGRLTSLFDLSSFCADPSEGRLKTLGAPEACCPPIAPSEGRPPTALQSRAGLPCFLPFCSCRLNHGRPPRPAPQPRLQLLGRVLNHACRARCSLSSRNLRSSGPDCSRGAPLIFRTTASSPRRSFSNTDARTPYDVQPFPAVTKADSPCSGAPQPHSRQPTPTDGSPCLIRELPTSSHVQPRTRPLLRVLSSAFRPVTSWQPPPFLRQPHTTAPCTARSLPRAPLPQQASSVDKPPASLPCSAPAPASPAAQQPSLRPADNQSPSTSMAAAHFPWPNVQKG